VKSLEFRESAWAWSTGISVAGELPGPLSSKAIHERQADGERETQKYCWMANWIFYVGTFGKLMDIHFG
jgi:hypothetical protein